jgi:adenylate cyclase
VTVGGEPNLLTEDELAERAGASVEQVRALVDLGILEPRDGGFERRDLARARVVVHLETMGIEPSALGQAIKSGHLRLGYFESAGRRFPRADRTFRDIAKEIGIPVEGLERIYVAFGLPRPAPDELVREEDLEAIRILPVLFAAGLDETDVLRMARVWGDSARRVAQYLPRYFHTTVEPRFRAQGLGDNDAYESAIRQVGVRTGRSGENLLGWLFRRHSEGFMNEHQFEHVEAALDEAGIRERTAAKPEGIAFADLSGFTTLTEQGGDEAAVEMALALAQLVGEAAARHGGMTVKLLGDGALLHFPDPGDAVRASLDIIDEAPARGLPPAHVGVNAGPLLFDQGDYFGRTINVASRIVGLAKPGQVLVGEAFVGTAPEVGFRLSELGSFEVKGVAHPIRVFEASRVG